MLHSSQYNSPEVDPLEQWYMETWTKGLWLAIESLAQEGCVWWPCQLLRAGRIYVPDKPHHKTGQIGANITKLRMICNPCPPEVVVEA